MAFELTEEAKIIDDYPNKTKIGKEELLKSLLQKNDKKSDILFYGLLSIYDDTELFSDALRKYGTVNTIINFSGYLERMISAWESLFQNMDNKERDDDRNNFEVVLKSILDKVERNYISAIKEVAQKDPKTLINSVKNTYAKDIDNEMPAAGAMLGLVSLEEEGLERLIYSIETTTDQTMLLLNFKLFGENCVIPILKAYENPKSTLAQKKAASIVIVSFPASPIIYDKIVEAYKHGRYFERMLGEKNENGDEVVSMEEFKNLAMSWWGNLITEYYKNDQEFINYVSLKHLENKDRQDKVIELLILTDEERKYSIPFLFQLNFEELSEVSLQELNMIFYKSKTSSKPLADDLFILYKKEFDTLSPEKRMSHRVIYYLPRFKYAYQLYFIEEYFNKISKEEKKVVIYLIFKKLPPLYKSAAYEIIRQKCDTEELEMLEFVK